MRRSTVAARAGLVFLLGAFALTGCGRKSTEKPEGLDALGTITAVTREDDSGTKASFDDQIDVLSESGKFTVVSSTKDVLKTVGEDKSAIGYLTVDAVDDSVKTLKVDGKEITDPRYPMTRQLYLVYKGKPNDLEQEFITYVTGKGQDIVKENFEPVKESVTFLSLKPKGTLKIGGSSSEAPVMKKLAEAYMKENPNADVSVETTDSGTGINGALEGTYDLGMSSRNPRSYEKDLLTFTPVARDRVAIIVAKDNPLEDITKKDLKSIYSGKAADWKDLK